MSPELFWTLAVLIAIGEAAFIFWPDDGYGRFSGIRQRLRRALLRCWAWQIQLIFGGRRRDW